MFSRPVVALKLIPLPLGASLGSYITSITTFEEDRIIVVPHPEILQRDLTVEAVNPCEHDILVKIDALGGRESHSLNVQVVTLKTPGEVLPCDHGSGKLSEGILVSDIERGSRVNVCAFLRALSVERVHAHEAQMNGPLVATIILIDPGHIHRFSKLNLGVENTGVSNYGLHMKLEAGAGVTQELTILTGGIRTSRFEVLG